MPGVPEILVVVFFLLALWLVLKLVRVAIRLIVFTVTIVILAGMFWFYFVR
jgi:hypothetical protein